MHTKSLALVTGANRGIGLEIAKQLAALGYTVLVGCRDAEKAKAAAQEVSAAGGKAQGLVLDTASRDSIKKAIEEISKMSEPLQILVNNAGIQLEAPGSWTASDASIFKADPVTIHNTLQTNTLGPLLLMQGLIPLMQQHGYGRVVNVSSGMGQLDDMQGGWGAYRLSKTSLNALTRIFAAEITEPNVKVNSICPGWVKTDMGSQAAPRTVEEGAKGAVWAATLPEDGPTGGFFRDGQVLPW